MGERRGTTGTRALEAWCRRLLARAPYEPAGVRVDNMAGSWRDGRAFCALVHRFRPDLIDFEMLKPENVYYNNELAFRMAETHLGIPALLDPEDMVNSEVPDRLSILTYLSQFYQRLGHTVVKTPTDNNDVTSPQSTLSPDVPLSPSIVASLKLGKSGYERCVVCDLPVYLAQRLLVSHKLYHRRCFRCVTCDTLLSPSNCYENSNSTEFCCEICKNNDVAPKLTSNDDDRMGMVMFPDVNIKQATEQSVKRNSERSSVLDRISIFEQKEAMKERHTSHDKLGSLHNKDVIDGKNNSIQSEAMTDKSTTVTNKNISKDVMTPFKAEHDIIKTIEMPIISSSLEDNIKISTDSSYKSNVNKLSFLQTQLSTVPLEETQNAQIEEINRFREIPTSLEMINAETQETELQTNDNNLRDKTHSTPSLTDSKRDLNVPDDKILEHMLDKSCKIDESSTSANKPAEGHIKSPVDDNHSLIIPPRRKNGAYRKSLIITQEVVELNKTGPSGTDSQTAASKPKSICVAPVEYPDDLNPFSEDEEEDSHVEPLNSTTLSTNPFGSSDDEEDESKDCEGKRSSSGTTKTAPLREKLAPAPNPFWSDGEEPSSDDETSDGRSPLSIKSNITSNTSNPQETARRSKPRAPLPPVQQLQDVPHIEVDHSCSLDDAASLSSMSSHCSTINSDYKAHSKLTPRSSPGFRKKRPAPTPPDCASIVSTGSHLSDSRPHIFLKGNNLFAEEPYHSASEGTWRRVKGPAPGLPLPGRRVVRPELTVPELQSQLDLLETQQLGLERQGVLIEQMIRDKCEGEEAKPTPQEEVEDLVIQLCELVNEKNDLFRKQTELMYIRRQQRLEQEQADIEHEIRVIQSRPAVNRIDADKAREEYLVGRLVAVVRLRDELVQQLDSERRREAAEDAAIAQSIAERRAKRNSDSNHSSLQSEDVVRTPKKSKVKDRVKKQLKKAKHSLNPKKKDPDGHSKEKNVSGEKEHKNKWF